MTKGNWGRREQEILRKKRKMRKGWAQVNENRAFLRREQKQGDYLNAL